MLSIELMSKSLGRYFIRLGVDVDYKSVGHSGTASPNGCGNFCVHVMCTLSVCDVICLVSACSADTDDSSG